MDTTLPLLLAVLLLSSVAPGLLIVSRLRWSPMEKLCGSFAASFIVTYLASFALFLLNAPPAAYWAISGVFLFLGLVGKKTFRLFLRNRRTRSALLAFAVLLAWDFLHLALVRNFAGGDWAGDWQEHYERTQYFLHQFGPDHLFLGYYPLPARPPMMNLMAAFVLRQTGLNFQAYSLCFLFWNAWAFLPCCLLLSRFAPRTRRLMPMLTILFMLNPSIIENATLTVTKALTAGLVIFGAALYLPRRIPAAAIVLAAAILVHYSAGPYAAAIGIHYLYTLLRRRASLTQAITAAASAAALLATWFAYSIAVFGAKVTFAANAMTIGIAQSGPAENLRRMLYNLFANLVPHPLHPIDDKPFSRHGNLGQLRDYYFLMSQTTLPMMMGIAGGIIVIALLFRRLLLSHPPLKSFWLFFIPFTFAIGTAVNIDWKPLGCAQITLQALSMIGVTFLASQLPRLKPLVFRLLLLGLAIDYSLGILLHFNRQSFPYPTIRYPNGQTIVQPDPTLGRYGDGEYLAKLQAGYVFWGDTLAPAAQTLQTASAIIAAAALARFARTRKYSSNSLD